MPKTLSIDLSKIAVIVATWNSGYYFDLFPGPLLAQGIHPKQVLVIDSESQDSSAERARSLGFKVHVIPKREFNHGGSRALAATLVPWAEILVYMTPDAIMATDNTLRNLVAVFADAQIGAAYGRQLPHHDADVFARHACNFNYPPESMVRELESRRTLGFKTVFLSNNLGAYRRTALEAVGSFPRDVITAEDSYVAGKMMMNGWKTQYVANACIYHSHNLTLTQIFRRYFDTGVFHAREKWLHNVYGAPAGEGRRFVLAELASLWPTKAWLIPKALLRTAFKYAGFRLGLNESRLSPRLKRRLGNFQDYWIRQTKTT